MNIEYKGNVTSLIFVLVHIFISVFDVCVGFLNKHYKQLR